MFDKGESSATTLDGISATLLEKMKKIADGTEEHGVSMEYSDDNTTDEELEKTKAKTTETRQGDPEKNTTPLSYAKATSANAPTGGFRPLLKNTLLCRLQSRNCMLDILLALEMQNLDEELEGAQLIRGNTVLELVMKTERAKNSILEKGLTIGGQHCRFFNSTPSRLPSRRTTVSILGLPLEAKYFAVGKVLEEMGYGKHLYTRPVMKKTPTKGTPYYSGILVAIMEDIKTPVPHFVTISGCRVRAIHNGQPARAPRQVVRTAEPTIPLQTPEETQGYEIKETAKELAEKVIEEELKEVVAETIKEVREKKPVEEKGEEMESEVREESTADDTVTEESEASKVLFKTVNKKKRRQMRRDRDELRKKLITESTGSADKAG